MRPKISAFVITCNNGSVIAECLSSLAWADEIVVVDDHSTDATQEICRRHGARLFQHEFKGFRDQKAHAVSLARTLSSRPGRSRAPCAASTPSRSRPRRIAARMVAQISARNDGVLILFDEVYPSKDRYVEIAEAYLSLNVSELDLRVGIQKFAWGTLDQFNPTDNLSPWDLRHPFTTDSLERKIGIPAVRALFGSSFSSVLVEAIWMPFYVPYRMPDPGDRWYPPLFDALTSYPTPDLGLPFELPPIDIVQVNTEPDLPPRTFENSDFGIRLSRTVGTADISVT